MKTLLYSSAALLLLLAATASPVTAASRTCDWVVGGPHTQLASATATGGPFGVDGVDGCWVEASGVSTSTTSLGEMHDMDVYWYDAGGNYLGSCATEASDESCGGPSGSAFAEVVAFLGAAGTTEITF